MLVNGIVNKFKDYVHLYGLRNTLQRVFKFFLSNVFHYSWEKAYLMSRKQKTEIQLQSSNEFTIRPLNQDDLFGDDHWKTYVEGCKDFLLRCFSSDFAKAYGAFVDDRLAYVTWILYGFVELNGKLIQAPDVATEWNVYCLPEFRGRGLHSYVKAWATNEMLRNGAQKCCSVTLAYNRPAMKTQEKLGYSVEKTFYIISLGKKKIYKWVR